MISKQLAKAGAVAMAEAASMYIPSGTVELANNVASVASGDEFNRPVYFIAMEAIWHRKKHNWIICRMPASCAYAMQEAWIRTIKGDSR